jgi:acetyl-CoA carboxylase carboxyl transferase subunit beta
MPNRHAEHDGRRTAVTSVRDTTRADRVLCQGCHTPVDGRRWRRHLMVCPECARHHPVTAAQRLVQLADPGSVEELDVEVASVDVLDFVDTKPYPERLTAARAATGTAEGVLAARASIEGCPLVIAVLDFRFLGGSLGAAAGETITLAAESALADALPLLLVSASVGARMQEGALSLMQLVKTSGALGQLDDAGLLTISLVTDPTCGGVAASFATLTDVIIAEPGARLGFAERDAVEQTARPRSPDDFRTAESLLARGFLDLIVPRHLLRDALARLLRSTVPARDRVPAGPDPAVRDPGRLPEPDGWDQVCRARDLRRPTTEDYLGTVFDDFQELHGDRVSGDSPAIIAGTALLDGRPVAVIGHQRGHDAEELARHDHGMAGPAGHRKAARVMRLAAKLRLPVITLVDTPGADPGASAEEQGQAVAVAENLKLMAGLPVPVITVITGEGGGACALALAVANRVLICANGAYSVVSPEDCATVLWQDPSQAPAAAGALRLGPRDLLRLGIVDGVLPEPEGGAGADPPAAADRLRATLRANLAELSTLDELRLVADRWARFRRFGDDSTTDPTLWVVGEGSR